MNLLRYYKVDVPYAVKFIKNNQVPKIRIEEYLKIIDACLKSYETDEGDTIDCHDIPFNDLYKTRGVVNYDEAIHIMLGNEVEYKKIVRRCKNHYLTIRDLLDCNLKKSYNRQEIRI